MSSSRAKGLTRKTEPRYKVYVRSSEYFQKENSMKTVKTALFSIITDQLKLIKGKVHHRTGHEAP